MWIGIGIVLFGAAFGAGLAIIGAGLGISKIAASAAEASARQPEVAGGLRVNMIITAAMIEGAALFALVVCFLIQTQVKVISTETAEAIKKSPNVVGSNEPAAAEEHGDDESH